MFLLFAVCLFLGCASAPIYRRDVLPQPVQPGGRYVETGMASWYGEPYHGRKTSSGEIYNMYALTAAHNRLPFGTIVKVENLQNRKTVTVTINDRGPFKRNRVIDLSYAAARAIEMVGLGSVRVRFEVLQWGEN